MSYVETAWNHANIPAELASLRPMGDFVLVRVLPEEEMHRNLIWLPQFSGAHGDRQMRPVVPSIGEVVACGPGDKAQEIEVHCKGKPHHSWWQWKTGSSYTEINNCSRCGAQPDMGSIVIHWDRRHPMHVSPGDRIMYWRVPANEVIINDQTFQFLHEEQHILGVIENG